MKRVETLTNVAVIIVALLIGAAVVKRHLLADVSGKDKSPPAREIPAGSKVPLPDIDWGKNGKTLLLALSPGCHYCSESAPFYQRLARETAAAGKAKLIAVFPTPVIESRKYLKEMAVEVYDVRQESLDAIGVTGTPTLILVDDTGVVTRAWIGQLQPDAEAEVLSNL
jgi:thiol-disulfide isomerase/thioredoxin